MCGSSVALEKGAWYRKNVTHTPEFRDLNIKKKESLLITDKLEEARGARQAGMQAVLVNRPFIHDDLPPGADTEFHVYRSYANIQLPSPQKRG